MGGPVRINSRDVVTSKSGGFASDHPARGSSAVIERTGTEMPEELFITFDFLMCAHDGWNALAQGLSQIHRRTPIRHVEMS